MSRFRWIGVKEKRVHVQEEEEEEKKPELFWIVTSQHR